MGTLSEDHLCELSLSISTKNIMSDTEQVMETEEVATPAAEPAVPEKMDVLTALKEVLKTALVNDALARGLHECAKLLEALCLEHNINLVKVPDSKQLGEWAGLCKIDNEGHPRKVVACSCVVVTSEFKKLSPAFEILLEHFRTNKA